MQPFSPYPPCPNGCGDVTTDITGGPCVCCQPPPPQPAPEPHPHDCGDPACELAGRLVDQHGHVVS